MNSAEKIILRAPEPEDLDVLFAMENDSRLWAVGTATGPYSRYQLKQYLSESRNDLYADRQLRFMIQHESGEVVGIIDLSCFDPRHNRAEVGIVVREDRHRQGIAREAISRLERHSFTLLGIHQLYAYVPTDNYPCLNLFRSSGFEETACLKDWIRVGTTYKDVSLLQKRNPFEL